MDVQIRIASESNLKSKQVRRRFVDRLIRNIRAALAVKGSAEVIKVELQWSRLMVKGLDSEEQLRTLSRVFGIHSVCPVEFQCEPEFSKICSTGLAGYRDRVKGRTFAVRASRSDVKGFRSIDIEREVGAQLYPFSAGVNLRNPELLISIEVGLDGANFFSRRIMGGQGLPIGVQGRALCLVSGGFDSLVAAWYMLKRGIEVDFVHCSLGARESEGQVLAAVKRMSERWCYGYSPTIYFAPFQSVLNLIGDQIPRSYRQLILKRCMYSIAAQLTAKKSYEAIITGECVGQVSSQTLSNLSALELDLGVPIFRPLLGFDKEEIISKSRMIGTCEQSEKIKELCDLAGRHPVTHAKRFDVDAHYDALGLEWLIDCMHSTSVVDLRNVEAAMRGPEAKSIYLDKIPKGAEVIDLRSQSQFSQWHVPGSKRLAASRVLESLESLERNRTYVLCCSVGLESALIAEQLRNAGFNAYSYRGGILSLRSNGFEA